jgi:hypothetical protein
VLLFDFEAEEGSWSIVVERIIKKRKRKREERKRRRKEREKEEKRREGEPEYPI